MTREVIVRSRYRIRLKRHHLAGSVSSYPTQTALDFYEEPVVVQLSLDGLDEVRLVAGYEWDPELRAVGRAVLSLRESRERYVWMEELPGSGASPTSIVRPDAPQTPSRPGISLGEEEAVDTDAQDNGS
ncbi:MAG: hypothetical protein ACRD2C_10730 [Acidimicrobiales bacterium]